MGYRIIPVTPLEQNCTLLWCEHTRRAVVMDPGGEVELILEAIGGLGIEPTRVLLTHGHIDHVGGAVALAGRLGVPIWGPHRADAFLLDALPEQARMFDLEMAAPFHPDRWLGDGDRIPVGDTALEVIHCPGHAPGHVVFYQADAGLALVGDVLFQDSIGRTDLPGGNHRALLNAIRNRLFPLGDAVSFVPGHGPMSTFGRERRHNPFLIPEPG